MKIEKPIFIVGVGRSGSTIFQRMFSEHPNAAWLSKLCDRYPAEPSRNRALMRAVDIPVVGPFVKKKCSPAECYVFWNHHFRGFARPCRDLVAGDVTEATRRSVTDSLSELITDKRRRLLLKITGWPRVGFLREIFPDARFIHICRDGRAVANSLLAVDFWWGWRGPGNWRGGELTPAQREEWESHGRSFVALAAIEWKRMMEAMDRAKQSIAPGNLIDIRYEDFAADPVRTFRDVMQFCDLEWSDRFERSLGTYSVRTANEKWKNDLTNAQRTILESVLGESLARYGYR